MARAGLGWSANDLADAAEVGYATVARFESGGVINDNSLRKLDKALKEAGASLTGGKGRVGVTVPQ
ncbi:helix-turn-helix domain-containing protein [Qipengyuania citrea]|uniref:helix-turn-helix domain-containing protein n=1 Tax=Qipengyuania citrea TaxID=225971 RepID=UPI0009FAD085